MPESLQEWLVRRRAAFGPILEARLHHEALLAQFDDLYAEHEGTEERIGDGWAAEFNSIEERLGGLADECQEAQRRVTAAYLQFTKWRAENPPPDA